MRRALRVHEQVEVALAVARLDVGQAVPLLGQRAQALREQRRARARRTVSSPLCVRQTGPATRTKSPTSSALHRLEQLGRQLALVRADLDRSPSSTSVRKTSFPNERSAITRPAIADAARPRLERRGVLGAEALAHRGDRLARPDPRRDTGRRRRYAALPAWRAAPRAPFRSCVALLRACSCVRAHACVLMRRRACRAAWRA